MLRLFEAFPKNTRLYLASADRAGAPHVTFANVEAAEDDRLTVSGWLCPQTLANLEANRAVALVGPDSDRGYQLTGVVEAIEVEGMMDGFTPAEEAGIPQVRYRLRVRLTGIMEMGDRPHTDRPLV